MSFHNWPTTGGIYQILNVKSGDCYIGRSVNLRRRANAHFNKLSAKNHRYQNGAFSHLQNAWLNFGENCFEFRIVQQLPDTCLKKAEAYWGWFFRASNKSTPAYNWEDFDVDELSPKMSEENRLALSKNRIGSQNPFYGKHHSDDAKRKISESNKARFSGAEGEKEMRKFRESGNAATRGKKNAKVSRQVFGISAQDGRRVEFASITEAAIATGGQTSHISECVDGKRKTCVGFKWFELKKQGWKN